MTNALGDDAKLIFEDADLIDSINDAQIDICRKTGLLSTDVLITLYSGTHGGYLLPTDLIELYRVSLNKNKLYKTTWQEVDQLDPGKDTGASLGVPTHYYTIGNQIYFYPESTTTYTQGVTLTYSRTPVAVTTDTDVPEIPQAFHEDICIRVIAKGHEQVEDFQAAQAKISEYNSVITLTQEQARNTNDESYPYIRDID